MARSGWQKFAEGREKGGRREEEEEGRQEQGRGREEVRGKKQGLSCGPWGPGGFLGSSRAVPGWSRVVLGGSRGAPWGPPGAVWEFLGSPQGILGCLLGFGGAHGAKTDDSGDLFLGLLASMLAVERATGDKAGNRRTCLPGGQNGRFWGPPLQPYLLSKKGAPQEDPSGSSRGSAVVKCSSVGAQTRALY